MRLAEQLCCVLTCILAQGCRCSDPAPTPDAAPPQDAGRIYTPEPRPDAGPIKWVQVHDLYRVVGTWGDIAITSRIGRDAGEWLMPYHYRIKVKNLCDCGLFDSKADLGYCLVEKKRMVTNIQVWRSGRYIRVRIGDDLEVVGAKA